MKRIISMSLVMSFGIVANGFAAATVVQKSTTKAANQAAPKCFGVTVSATTVDSVIAQLSSAKDVYAALKGQNPSVSSNPFIAATKDYDGAIQKLQLLKAQKFSQQAIDKFAGNGVIDGCIGIIGCPNMPIIGGTVKDCHACNSADACSECCVSIDGGSIACNAGCNNLPVGN